MAGVDVDEVIARHAVGRVTDGTSIVHAGLDSLAILRIVVAVADPGQEIAVTRLPSVRTVGDLKAWLADLGPSARSDPAPSGQADGR